MAIDILDPTKKLKDQVKINNRVTAPRVRNVVTPPVIAPPKIETPVETPVESDLARQGRERHEAELAFEQKQIEQGITPETRKPFEQRQADRAAEAPPVEEEAARDFAAEARAAELARIKAAFDQALGTQREEIGVAREALVPQFRTERGRIGTEDVMSRKGLEKIQATQGLAGAGAATQSDIAQSVITAGAMGESRARESERRAELDRLEQQAIRETEFGKAQAEAGASIQELEAMAQAQAAQTAAELKQAEIRDERDYDLFIRELDKFDEREMLQFKNAIEQENTILDAEIQRARDERDFGTATALEAQKAANNIKLQGVRDAGARALEGQRQAGRLELEAEKQAGRLEEEEVAAEGDQFEDRVFTTGIDRELDALGEFTEPVVLKTRAAELLVDSVKAGDITSDEQLKRLMIQYGLSESDIDQFLGGTPGIGGLNIGG